MHSTAGTVVGVEPDQRNTTISALQDMVVRRLRCKELSSRAAAQQTRSARVSHQTFHRLADETERYDRVVKDETLDGLALALNLPISVLLDAVHTRTPLPAEQIREILMAVCHAVELSEQYHAEQRARDAEAFQ